MTIIRIDDEIGYWGITAQDVVRQLNEASGDIVIEISSPGGSVYEGVAIFNAIKSYNKGAVTTKIMSLAASMASIIALSGDRVVAFDNSVFMIHNALMGVIGNADYLRKKADHLDSISNMLAKTYISKTGKTDQEIKKAMDEETYFYGNEIFEYGFVDEIIQSSNGVEQDHASAIILATENVKNCMNNYKEKGNNEEVDKIAAIIKDLEKEDKPLGVNPASAQIKINPKGESMSQKTYTEAEFKALKDENAEALEVAQQDAVSLERERTTSILALQGDQAIKLKAIEDGSTVGDAAIALNKSMAESFSKQKADFEKAAEELEDNKTPEDNGEDLSEEDKAKAEANEALNKVFGEK